MLWQCWIFVLAWIPLRSSSASRLDLGQRREAQLLAHYSFDDLDEITQVANMGLELGEENQTPMLVRMQPDRGLGLHLDGNDAVSFPGLDLRSEKYSQLTLGAWVKPLAGGGDSRYIFRAGSIGLSLGVGANGSFFLHMGDGDTLRLEAGSLTLDEWFLVAAIVDAPTSRVTFYVSGSSSEGSFAPRDIANATPGLLVLGGAGGDGFIGLVDDIFSYAEALSTDELDLFLRAPTLPRMLPSAGPAGYALSLAGAQYVDMGPIFVPTDSEVLALAIWLRPTSIWEEEVGLWECEALGGASSVNWRVSLRHSAGYEATVIRLEAEDPFERALVHVSCPYFALQSWHHLRIVWSSEGAVIVDADGEACGTSAAWSVFMGAGAAAGNLRLGTLASSSGLLGSWFLGDLDDAQVWSSSDFAGTSRETLLTGLESDLVAHWRFDEGRGDLARDSSYSRTGPASHGALRTAYTSLNDVSPVGWVVSEVPLGNLVTTFAGVPAYAPLSGLDAGGRTLRAILMSLPVGGNLYVSTAEDIRSEALASPIKIGDEIHLMGGASRVIYWPSIAMLGEREDQFSYLVVSSDGDSSPNEASVFLFCAEQKLPPRVELHSPSVTIGGYGVSDRDGWEGRDSPPLLHISAAVDGEGASLTTSHIDGLAFDLYGEGDGSNDSSVTFLGTEHDANVAMSELRIHLLDSSHLQRVSLNLAVDDELSPSWVGAKEAGVRVDYEQRFGSLPFIVSVAPSGSPVGGGGYLTVYAADVVPEGHYSCAFSLPSGSIELRIAVHVTFREFGCEIPPAQHSGPASVCLIDGMGFSSNFVSLEYFDVPVILGVFPSQGPLWGGTQLSIQGTGFFDSVELKCSVGGVLVPAQYISPFQVKCVAPPWHGVEPTEVDIGVAFNGLRVADDHVAFRYMPPPLIGWVEPLNGNELHYIAVHGAHFVDSADLACSVGGILSSASFVSSALVHCRIPALEGNSSSSPPLVAVATNGVDFSRDIVPFFFTSLPEVWAVVPSLGPTLGGTRLLVSGKGFAPLPEPSCTFAQGEKFVAVKADFLDSGSVACITPPFFDPGEAHLSVHGSRSYVTFIYHVPVLAHAVTPSSVSSKGGDSLLVMGQGFIPMENLLRCIIWDDVGDFFLVPAELILEGVVRCLVPPLRPGVAHVTVSNNPGESADPDTAVAIVVYATPQLGSLSPSSGISLGGTSVFLPTMSSPMDPRVHIQCRVGSAVVDAVAVSGGIRFTSPSADAAGIDPAKGELATVQVIADGRKLPSMVWYKYVHAPLIHSMSPVLGSVVGGTEVTITGLNLLPLSSAYCKFGATEVPAMSISPLGFSMSCISPSVSHPQSLALSISLNDGENYATRVGTFSYIPALSLDRLEGHPNLRLSQVFVWGSGFYPSPALSCLVNGNNTLARWMSPTLVDCELPATPKDWISTTSNGTFEVHVSNNGVDSEGDPLVYDTSAHTSVVVSAYPLSGPLWGGTQVHLLLDGDIEDVSLFRCYFGTNFSPLVLDSAVNEALCISPPGVVAGEVSFWLDVGLGFRPSPGDDLRFSYFYPPTVEDLAPTHVLVGSQARDLLIVGSQFSTGARCRFGTEVAIEYSVMNSTHMLCSSPSPLLSDTFITISANDGADWSSAGRILSVVPAPGKTSLSPETGPREGGTRLEVRGVVGVDLSPMCEFTFIPVGGSVLSESTQERSGFVSCMTPSAPLGAEGASVRILGDTLQDTQGLVFSYEDAIELRDLVPSDGLTHGGTRVEIVGANFNPASLVCRFGDIFVRPHSDTINSTYAQCESPPALPGVSQVFIEVSNNLVDFTSVGLVFQYRQPLTLDSLSPRSGPLEGGTIVHLQGLGFSGHVSCKFGSVGTVAALIETESSARCVSPPARFSGRVSLEISFNDVDFTPSGMYFEYMSLLSISSMHPSLGPESGGTIVHLVGAGFSPNMICEFGSSRYRSPLQHISSTSASCTTPQMPPGDMEVSLSTNGQQFSPTGLTYSVHAMVSVSSVAPASGPSYGGYSIQVNGSGFVNTSSLSAAFGSRVVYCSYGDPSSITCPLPEGKGNVTVMASLNGLDFGRKGSSFEYLPDITHWSPRPKMGSASGGTVITLTAEGSLNGAAFIRFGGSTVSELKVQAGGSLTVTAPLADSPGSVLMELLGKDMHPLTSETHAFHYYSPYSVYTVVPSSGTESGGTELMVLGQGFMRSLDLSCTFQREDRADVFVPALFISSSIISCISPEAPVGISMLSVTVNGQDVSTQPVEYHYLGMSTVSSLWPSSGSILGGNLVTVHGTELHGDGSDLFCRFGDVHVPVESYIDPTRVLCRAPPSDRDTQVKVHVANSFADISSGGAIYSYHRPLRVLSIGPQRGSVAGGTPVRITGAGFHDSMMCRFGHNHIVPAAAESATVALCASPRVDYPGWLPVSLSRNGVDFELAPHRFEYVMQPLISSISPVLGSETGGTIIRVAGLDLAGVRFCRFGSSGDSIPARPVSNTMLECTLPPLSPSTYDIELSINGRDYEPAGISFEVHFSLSVMSVSPGAGRPYEQVSISGSGFLDTNGLRAAFGSSVALCDFVTPSLLSCTVPLGSGSPLVSVSLNGLDYVGSAQFHYVEAPALATIAPSLGPRSGGTYIKVSLPSAVPGAAWPSSPQCRVGGILSQVVPQSTDEVYSEGHILCIAPPLPSAGDFSLEILSSPAEGGALIASSTYEAYEGPTVLAVYPSSADEAGGVYVEVRGRGFVQTSYLRCKFGDAAPVEGLFVTENIITCKVPPASHLGDVAVGVTMNGFDFVELPAAFRYYPCTSAHSISPSLGSSDGGMEVTVRGSGFEHSSMPRHQQWVCAFGTELTEATNISEGALVCKTPRHAPGVVPLVVLGFSAEVASPVGAARSLLEDHSVLGCERRSLSFEFVDRITVGGIIPASGTMNGGTPVRIILSGLREDDVRPVRCFFGGVGVLADRISANEVICISPSFSLGPSERAQYVDLQVAAGDQLVTFQGNRFLYHRDARILGFTPPSGSEAGGTPVILSGSFFPPSVFLECHFDGNIVRADWLSSETIRCISPPGRPGQVSLHVSGMGMDVVDAPMKYLYIPVVTIESLSPSWGPVEGGTSLVVKGTGFQSSTRALCRFGFQEVKATRLDDTTLTCISPPSPAGRVVEFALSMNDGGDWVKWTSDWAYRVPLLATHLLPSYGAKEGGTLVSIFYQMEASVTGDLNFVCRFGHVEVDAVTVTPFLISCRSPPMPIAENPVVSVDISLDGGMYFTSSGLQFFYVQAPEVTFHLCDTALIISHLYLPVHIFAADNGCLSFRGHSWV
jgi:hypothetical protein